MPETLAPQLVGRDSSAAPPRLASADAPRLRPRLPRTLAVDAAKARRLVRRRRDLWVTLRSLGTSMLVFLAVLPIAAVAHQSLFLAAAVLLRDVTRLVEARLLPALPLDPVYAGAALRILGGIEPAGLGVAGGLGWTLHGLAPAIFGSPSLVAPGAIVSALVAPGATVTARALCTLLATTVASIVAADLGGRIRRPAAQLSLSMVRVWLLLGLVRETALDVRELDATGLPFAFAMLSPVAPDGQRPLLTRQLELIPEPAVELATSLVAILVCLVATFAVRALVGQLLPVARLVAGRGGRRPLVHLLVDSGHRPAPTRLGLVCAGLPRLAGLAALAGVVVLTPLDLAGSGRPAIAASNTESVGQRAVAATEDGADGRAAPTRAEASRGEPTADGSSPPGDDLPIASATVPAPPDASAEDPAASAGASSPTVPSRPPATPAVPVSGRGAGGSVVTVSGNNYRYTYSVNGEPTVIRGMGYNPWYARLPHDQRRQRYARDFATMRDVGINTIEGWFQDQFDEVTLGEAQRHGLGVILPFELNQDYDYSDPAVKARFRDQVTAWVLRYRDHPALLMWGPGNEVMHRLIFPTAVQGKRDATQDQRADDFATFYAELIDLIHQLDPDHPIIYRDAEDLYFARIRQALLRDGKHRPWFIYGTNVYTQRLAEVIRNWPSQGLDAPLLVSEFSPGGVGPAERPRMLGWYWSAIRAHPERVIGGVVYTWTTGGPEDLDRIFGLTDESGRPVDGSLAALRRLFRTDEVGRSGPA